VQSVRIIADQGGRVDWDPSGSDRIAFDRQDADGFYDVYTISADGTGLVSITDGRSAIGQRNNGNPCWHPSGRWIVFQSEHPQHFGLRNRWASDPGVGCYCDLWVTDPDGQHFSQLTHHRVKQRLFDGLPVMGVLNPHFSPDGKWLVWTERYGDGGRWGRWRVWRARWSVSSEGVPALQQPEVVFTPGEDTGCYVTCLGVTPDNRRLLLAGNLSGPDHDEFGMDLYLYDLEKRRLVDLTRDPKEWTEGAALTPAGTKIIYMSNKGWPMDFSDQHWYWQKRRREYWMMNLDGSGKQRVTYFNTPGHREYRGRRVIVADCSWSPDGRRLAATLGEDMSEGEKADFHLRVAVITFTRGQQKEKPQELDNPQGQEKKE